MSLNSLKRASNIEISSQLTGDVNTDTPQKVNIDALKLKMIKQEKKENFKNKTIVVSLFLVLGVVGYFVSI
tara:strand:- start:137 stop:349 length:213 start_codon:yes stop_codon:yes gene_type:complete